MGLAHVVVTTVTRDDLPDGGAAHFVAVIEALREVVPDATIEVLTSDFAGAMASVDSVTDARPDVFNHNLETVPRLYPEVRPGAHYRRSLDVLERVKRRCEGPARPPCPPSRASCSGSARHPPRSSRSCATCARWAATC
jgi:lipoyl synthase